MKVMAQLAMVMNLDKCIGCHTCSVTCKQAWTNRSGVEYVWFNNVETRPGQGYPRTLPGPGAVAGRLDAQPPRPAHAQGRRPGQASCFSIFANPVLPTIDDYYEPWTYDYENLTRRPARRRHPGGPADSRCSPAKPTKIEWSANWDDALGGGNELAPLDPIVQQLRDEVADKVRFEYEQSFMFFLPRICEHCLNPSCVASCPSGAMYKRSRGRHRARRPGPLPRLADVRHRLPVQEGLLQPPHRQGREVHVLLPAGRGRPAHRLLGDLRRPAALHRPGALRRRPRDRGGRRPRTRSDLYEAQLGLILDPTRPGGRRRGAPRRHPRRLDRRRRSARRSGR